MGNCFVKLFLPRHTILFRISSHRCSFSLTTRLDSAVGIMAGLRSDDLCDARFFFENQEAVECTPHFFNLIALAARGGKGNAVCMCVSIRFRSRFFMSAVRLLFINCVSFIQNGVTEYALLGQHREPLKDALGFLAMHIIWCIRKLGLPLIQMIEAGDIQWRTLRL